MIGYIRYCGEIFFRLKMYFIRKRIKADVRSIMRLARSLDTESVAEVLEDLDSEDELSSCLRCGEDISSISDAFCSKCGFLNSAFSEIKFRKSGGRTLSELQRIWCADRHRESKALFVGLETLETEFRARPFCAYCGANLEEFFS